MTVAEMRAFLVANVPGFNPAASDLAVADAYAAYTTSVDPAEPLSVDEVKLNLKVTSTREDTLIAGLIVAAREHAENETGMVLTRRTVTETAQVLGRWIDLTSWPIVSIDAIRYPGAGGLAVLPGAAWQASYARRPVRVLPVAPGWGAGALAVVAAALPVEIDVTAGFASPAAVPVTLKQAMHLLVAHWWSNRSAVEAGATAGAVEVPLGVDALLQRWKLARV